MLLFSFASFFNGDIFNVIWQFLTNFWGLVTQLFSSFINGLVIVSSVISIGPVLNGFFPTVLSTSIYLVISIGVIKLVAHMGQQ